MHIQKIDKCRSCDSILIKPFFDLGDQPLANGLVESQQQEAGKYPLSLSFCEGCGLVQLDHTIDPELLFTKYLWVTSTSSTAREYSESFCENVLGQRNICDSLSYILEIASNDGTFLKPFLNRGHNVLGIDPAQNIVKMARAENIPTLCGFFGVKSAKDILSEYGSPDIVIARNVLPHVANLHDFMEGIQLCMSNETLLVIEVHYAKTILEELHYDSIYHEHLCYFTFKTLKNLFLTYGIHIIDILPSPISGGSIVVFAAKAVKDEKPYVSDFEREENNRGSNDYLSWKQFAESAHEHRAAFKNILENEYLKGRKVAGYGASARSSTMLNFSAITKRLIPVIADQNPNKEGLFTPGSNIPIKNPDEVMADKPDTIVILAWNFLEELASILLERFHFNGKILIPLPHFPKLISMEEYLNGRSENKN